ncbi:hypothetical protein D3C77_527830 [compost metagenome]
MGSIAIIERYAKISASTFDCVEYFLTFLLVHGHRLFGNDVTAQLHSANDIIMVSSVNCTYKHIIRLRFLDHAIKVFRLIGSNLMIVVFVC